MNNDIETRDKLIFGRYRERKYRFGNSLIFEGMTLGTLQELISKDYVSPEDRVGLSPTVQEICDFMEQYRGYTCHGCATLDQGVKITGVAKMEQAQTPEECQAFLRLFGDATELRVEGYMYAYYKEGN